MCGAGTAMTVEDPDVRGADTAWEPSWIPGASRVWSDRAERWVTMEFRQYQAWLARPDLDPVEFEADRTGLS